jgi:hypothetical protein
MSSSLSSAMTSSGGVRLSECARRYEEPPRDRGFSTTFMHAEVARLAAPIAFTAPLRRFPDVNLAGDDHDRARHTATGSCSSHDDYPSASAHRRESCPPEKRVVLGGCHGARVNVRGIVRCTSTFPPRGGSSSRTPRHLLTKVASGTCHPVLARVAAVLHAPANSRTIGATASTASTDAIARGPESTWM